MNGAARRNAPWPIVPRQMVELSEDERRRLRLLADNRAQETRLKQAWHQSELLEAGWAPGPVLYLEDHRPIELMTERGAKAFEYRSLGLAGDGDYYLVSQPRDRAFEAYIGDHIGLGHPQVLKVPPPQLARSRRLARAAIDDGEIFSVLTEAALRHGTLTISPFIASSDAWVLARAIAQATRTKVFVLGPPPALTACCNSKLWFADLVVEVLNKAALPVTLHAENLVQAAFGIIRLSQSAETVVVKVPSSAGAMGNIKLSGSVLTSLTPRAIYRLLKERLAQVGWDRASPLLLSVWEEQAIASPSAQIWIPTIDAGDPVVEGVFAQAVGNEQGGFEGAGLFDGVDEVIIRIQTEALQIAFVLQHLGYVGRLSLDALLLDGAHGPILHWIEANARWGGVSIPMTIAHRLQRDVLDWPFQILQFKLSNQDELPLPSVYHELPDDGEDAQARTVFLSPPETGRLNCFITASSSGALMRRREALLSRFRNP